VNIIRTFSHGGVLMSEPEHAFGGKWTQDKLERLRRYLKAYATALKNQPFRLMYVDAFAGTGYRGSKADKFTVGGLFEMPEVDELVKGSARIALEVDPPFDQYVFIEKNKRRFAALKRLETEFPERRDRMRFVQKEANTAIQELCHTTDWRTIRAVMFLDPYGMQVDWQTIETIAATRCIDLWYLFPAGMGVVRLTPRHGDIPQNWQARLDRMLPDSGWRDVFYVEEEERDLFGNLMPVRKKATDIARIEAYLLRNMKAIFAGVAEHGLPLRNSRNQCMYLLVFASGNPKGAPIALKIAQHILKN
jgi:three-Cys-motif partner protein